MPPKYRDQAVGPLRRAVTTGMRKRSKRINRPRARHLLFLCRIPADAKVLCITPPTTAELLFFRIMAGLFIPSTSRWARTTSPWDEPIGNPVHWWLCSNRHDIRPPL